MSVIQALHADTVLGVGLVRGATGALASIAVAALGASRDADVHLHRVDFLAGRVGGAGIAFAARRSAILANLVATIAFLALPILLATAALGLLFDALARVLVANLAGSARGVKARGVAVELHGDALLAGGGKCVAHPARGAVIIRFTIGEAEGRTAQRLAGRVGAIRILRAGNAGGDLVAGDDRRVGNIRHVRVNDAIRNLGIRRRAGYALLESVANLTGFRALGVTLAFHRRAEPLVRLGGHNAFRSAEWFLTRTFAVLGAFHLGTATAYANGPLVAVSVDRARRARTAGIARPSQTNERQNCKKPSKTHAYLHWDGSPETKAFEIVPSEFRNSRAMIEC